MMKSFVIALGAMLLTAASAMAQPAPRNYDKESVTLVQEFQIAPGKFNTFMQDYATNQRASFEIGKKVGGILGYGVSQPITRRPGEPNLYLIITFKDLASYDRSFERADQTAIAVYGSLEKAAAAGAKRSEYATLISSRLLQNLKIVN
ncbi:hypothetical protein [Phenylobacterium sp.]|uniref:hypothetical protein n=1 Tax=Phenylobacterium sp. TaxID=1871053 RepID=UPI001225B0FB|nr:hypothetical protein [Phenylobacterium sp.]TAL29911.1 MAG: hypothetical protein EPN98_19150 [Phenylobacterium sp.]